MNNFLNLINTMKEWLDESPGLIQEAKTKDSCFTRNGKISDKQLSLYGLIHAPGAISENLVDLYGELGVSVKEIPTKQALSQKRKLIDETPFVKAFESLVGTVYQPENLETLKTFNGFFTVGVDGTDIAIPNNPRLKEVFGTTGRGTTSVTARGSVALDLLNGYLLDGQIEALKEGEIKLMQEHLKNVPKNLPADKILLCNAPRQVVF